MTDKTGDDTYKYSVFKGNYPNQIRKAMARRKNWDEIDNEVAIDEAHFIWRAVNYGANSYVKIDQRMKVNPEKLVFNHF